MKAFISSEQAFLFILHINAEVWIKLVQIDEFGFGVYFCGPSALICPFGWWEQRESNPRPSACKADALNQLSYAPVFRFFWLITASDFVSLLLTTSRLLRRPSLVFLVLN